MKKYLLQALSILMITIITHNSNANSTDINKSDFSKFCTGDININDPEIVNTVFKFCKPEDLNIALTKIFEIENEIELIQKNITNLRENAYQNSSTTIRISGSLLTAISAGLGLYAVKRGPVFGEYDNGERTIKEIRDSKIAKRFYIASMVGFLISSYVFKLNDDQVDLMLKSSDYEKLKIKLNELNQDLQRRKLTLRSLGL